LLVFVGGHCRAASMSAGDNKASKMLTLQIQEILSATILTK
jgi:hypothetical protein